jgi:phosphoheptose isomerase
MFITLTFNKKESIVNTDQITRVEIMGGDFALTVTSYAVHAFFSDGKNLVLGNFVSIEEAQEFLKGFFEKYLKKE